MKARTSTQLAAAKERRTELNGRISTLMLLADTFTRELGIIGRPVAAKRAVLEHLEHVTQEADRYRVMVSAVEREVAQLAEQADGEDFDEREIQRLMNEREAYRATLTALDSAGTKQIRRWLENVISSRTDMIAARTKSEDDEVDLSELLVDDD